MAISESRDITIEATFDEVMAVLYDVESLPEWSPSHQEVEILERGADGHPSKVRQVIKIVGVNEEQILAYTVYDDGVGWTLEKGQGQRAQNARYTLTPAGESTHVHFDLTVDLVLPIPDFLVKRGAKTLMEMSTHGLRKRVLQAKKGK